MSATEQITRGIILAGGSGTRMYPMTKPFSKQLITIYNKPLIYYALSTLMLGGIRNILIITTPDDQRLFQKLLGSGTQWGLDLTYDVQPEPRGLAQAITIAEPHFGPHPVALILGDNLFYGHDLPEILRTATTREEGATIFGYTVRDPERYGVIEFDHQRRGISLEEKPVHPKSNVAVVGLYFYDRTVYDRVREQTPSARGELEITDLNRTYLNDRKLHVELLGRGYAWLDTGTPRSLLEATQFVQVIEERQGLMIACPEEIAWHNGWIRTDELIALGQEMKNSEYGQYLLRIATA